MASPGYRNRAVMIDQQVKGNRYGWNSAKHLFELNR